MSRFSVVSSKSECANCAEDRSMNLFGVCSECYTLYLSGKDVKIKDYLDKDVWSCGCHDASYGDTWSETRCQKHSVKN
jgi:hypothetical protein